MRRAGVVLAALLASACVLKRSQPARLFVLDALATGTEAPAAGARPGLGVLRVTVPDWLDRPEITARMASGEIRPDEMARWGEPLGRGIQRVVAENLAVLLPDRAVARAPFAAGPSPEQRLAISVVEAARQPDGTVRVETRWSVMGREGAALVQRRSTHSAAAATDAAATVRALNEALAALSREIADAVRALPPAAAPAASP